MSPRSDVGTNYFCEKTLTLPARFPAPALVFRHVTSPHVLDGSLELRFQQVV